MATYKITLSGTIESVDDVVLPPPPPLIEKPPLYPNSIANTDFDFILGTDPDASTAVTTMNGGVLQANIEMPGDPANGPLIQSAYVFEVSYSDTTWKTKVYCNKAFGSSAAALLYANKLRGPLGKLPKIIRENFYHVVLHKGDGTFSSEDSGHFIMLYSVKMDLRITNHDLEESCFHEGVHASLQKADGGKGVAYLGSPTWNAAVIRDNAFITEYAKTDPQEDFAESALFAYTIIKHPERFPAADLLKIKAQIPNRIEFFRKVFI